MSFKKFYIVFLLVISLTLFSQNVNPGDEGEGREGVLIDFNQTGSQDKEEYLYQNDNWLLDLNSSSDFKINRKNTYAKNVQDRGGNNYIGVRVNFPEYPNNSYALLKPPYPFVFEAGSLNADNTGIIYNVKEIRKIAVRIAGRYFPHVLFVDLEDVNRRVTSYKMGSLNFYGWRDVEWVNKELLTDVRDNLLDLDEIPSIYPRILDSVKLNGIKFFRSGEREGGDFITYVGSINLTYNNVINIDALKTDTDEETYIEDEDVWKIQEEVNKNFDDSYDNLFENFKFRRQIFRDRVNYQGADAAAQPAAVDNNDNAPAADDQAVGVGDTQ